MVTCHLVRPLHAAYPNLTLQRKPAEVGLVLSCDISLFLMIFHECLSLNERDGDRILITVHLHICLSNFEKMPLKSATIF